MKKAVRIKICGLTRYCDADFVSEAMPDYAGFVFAPGKRQVDRLQAERLRAHLDSRIKIAGVFANEEIEKILEIACSGLLDCIQLHGQEDAAYVRELKASLEKMENYDGNIADKGRIRKFSVIKALSIDSNRDFDKITPVYEAAGADYFLFDHGAGGTGRTFDWSCIPKVNIPYFLAGGLHPGNIEEALDKTNPYAVDVSSGVETEGYKDRRKILEMVRRVRNV